MESAVSTLFAGFRPQSLNQEVVGFYSGTSCCQRAGLVPCKTKYLHSLSSRYISLKIPNSYKLFAAVSAAPPVVCNFEDDVTSVYQESAASENNTESRELKIRVDVSGARTQAIFDDVFSKLVAAAQPIPGFRRVKGGKTPDIPKDILLHILGPSKVNKQAIQKIINTTVTEIVEEEGMNVTANLKIEQGYEELEATFEPGKGFSFDAILELNETDISND